VAVAINGIQSHQFARKIKAGNLFITIIAKGVGFDGAGKDSIDGAEAIILVEHMLPPFQGSLTLHDFFQLFQVRLVDSAGQAKLMQAAIFTCDLDAGKIDNSIAV
jgi:hypothetical protein